MAAQNYFLCIWDSGNSLKIYSQRSKIQDKQGERAKIERGEDTKFRRFIWRQRRNF